MNEPPDGDTNMANLTNFWWVFLSNYLNSNYGNIQYQIATDSLFISPTLDTICPFNISPVLAYSLFCGETYYWRIREITIADTSQWSVVYSFTMHYHGNYYPQLIEPANLSTGNNNPIHFHFMKYAGAAYNEIIIDTTIIFANPIIYNTTDSFYNATLLPSSNYYYWKVRNNYGTISSPCYSRWSNTWKFLMNQTNNINMLSVNSKLSVLPNPFTDELIINIGDDIKNKPFTLTITDLLGRKVYSNCKQSEKETFIKIDTKNLQSGLYLLKISSEQQNNILRVLKE
jgi:hypothetical protein